MANLKRTIRYFDKKDLEKAQQTIERIINTNEDYKSAIVRAKKSWFGKEDVYAFEKFREESLFEGSLYKAYGYLDERGVFKGTILDEVLYKIFSGEDRFSFFTTIDTELNYINLAQWLIDKGLRINSDNEEAYVLAYEKLIDTYKDLYGPDPYTFHRYLNIDSFQKIFASLDPILEKIISKSELRKKLQQMQQELREIKAHPQEFSKKLEEEYSRRKYIEDKARQIQRIYTELTGDWSQETSSFESEVQFDEEEYQEWKRTGRLREGSWQQGYQYMPQQDTEGDLQNKIKELNGYFNLPADASAEITMKHVKNYIKQEHPDTLKSRTDISLGEKEEREMKFGEFMGKYDSAIKELKKQEKRKKQEELARE
jgi:hypothetical protein